jgi:hypothetical protein
MYRPAHRLQQPPREGIILLVVITLLTLFALAGLAFVYYAQAKSDAARVYREARDNKFGGTDGPDTPPEELFGEFLRQAIYDVGDDAVSAASAMRGHSFARTMYGYNYDVTQRNLILNNNAYNGTGKLHTGRGTYMNTFQVDDYVLPNYQWFSNDPFVRDPERWPQRQAAPGAFPPQPPNTFTGGFNAPYTYPDVNSMFLAAVAADGTVLMPSFYRPWLFEPNYPAIQGPQNPYWTAPGQGAAVLKYMTLRPRPGDQLLPGETWPPNRPYFPPPADFGGDVKNLLGSPGTLYKDPVSGQWQYANNDSYWMDIGSPVRTLPDGRKYKALYAPLIIDLDNRVNLNIHGNVRGRQPNGQPNTSNPTAPHVSNHGLGPWEVNLQYVLNQQTPQNVPWAYEWPNLFVGNQQAGGYAALIGRYGQDMVPDSQPASPNNTGWGGGYAHFYAQIDYDGCNESPNGQGGQYGPTTPMLPPTGQGPWPNFLTQTGQYGGYGNGLSSASLAQGKLGNLPPPQDWERTNHPGLYNIFQPGGDDRLFDPSNIAALIRDGSIPVDPLSDLAQLLPVNLGLNPPAYPPPPSYTYGVARTRRLATTLSWDVERPGPTPWVYPGGTYGYVGVNGGPAPTPDQAPQGAPIPFPPLTNRPQALATTCEFGLQGSSSNPPTPNEWRNIFAALGRVDLNRQLTPYPSYSYGSNNPSIQDYAGRYDSAAAPAGLMSQRFKTVFAQYQQAQADRQQLASDIFARLVSVTGAPMPAVPAAANDPALPALRWLGQLAVNIVDYVDEDDISTPFNFYGSLFGIYGGPPLLTAPQGQTPWLTPQQPAALYWVFGVELPHVLLNEALGEVKQPPGGNGQTFNQFWVELYNPFQYNIQQSGLCSPPDAAPVQLYMQKQTTPPQGVNPPPNPAPYAPYQIVIAGQTPAPPGVPTGSGNGSNDNVLGWPDWQTTPYPTGAWMSPAQPGTKPGAIRVMTQDGDWQPTNTVAGGAQGNNPTQGTNNEPSPWVGYVGTQGMSPYFLIGPGTTPVKQTDTARQAIKNSNPPVPPGTPWLGSQRMSYPVTYAGGKPAPNQPNDVQPPAGGPAPPGVQILLMRLANPHMPFDPNPTHPLYNPYINVDYLESVKVYDMTQTAATDQSWGRMQPYGADPTLGQQLANQTGPSKAPARPPKGTGQTTHSFGQANAPGPKGSAAWLIHLDRGVISPLELLHVSGCQPYQLTHKFLTQATPNGGGHLAPWLDENRRLFRALDYFIAHSRVGGVDQSDLVNPQDPMRAPMLPELLRMRKMRVPGRINLNTMFEPLDLSNPPLSLFNYPPATFQALCDSQPGNSFSNQDVVQMYLSMMLSRTPTMAQATGPNGQTLTYFIPGPTNATQLQLGKPYQGPLDIPFWSLGAPISPGSPTDQQWLFLKPQGATPAVTFGINNTILRPPTPTGGNPFGVNPPASPYPGTWVNQYPGLFTPPSLLPPQAKTPPPLYWQTQLLNKIYNNTTTRSHVFAVYLTVGFFQVIQDTDQFGQPLTPVKLGAEIGSTTGTQVRHHMFAIVDRSALTIRPQDTVPPGNPPQWPTVGQGNQPPQWQTSAPNHILTTGLNTVMMPNPQQNPMVDQVGIPRQVPPPLWAIRPGTILTVDLPPPYGTQQETVVVTAIDQQNNPPQWFQAKFNKIHVPINPQLGIPIWLPDLGNPGPQPTFQPQDDSAVVPYYTIED